jgi:putative transposase
MEDSSSQWPGFRGKGHIQEICAVRVRYGYRRVQVLLEREGWQVNHKRTYRLYKELGLQLRHKTPKRRVKAKLREDRRPAIRPNERASRQLSGKQR